MASGDYVKADPDLEKPLQSYGYEDFGDGDLEIPSPMSQAWVAKFPREVYEELKNMNDDQEICIGYMRHWPQANKWRMMLDPSLERNKQLPKEYKIHVTGDKVQNTFVFSEKDLPGFKKGTNDNRGGAGGQGANFAGVDKTRRYKPRGIPKHTKLETVVQTEITCDASDTPEYRAMLKRKKHVDDPAIKATFVEGNPLAFHKEYELERTKRAARYNQELANAAKKNLNRRAPRMPKNDLLDRLYECFSQYAHWHLAQLRNRIDQPDEYLKETVQEIAYFDKKGEFYGTYQLKPEFRSNIRTGANVSEEVAPGEDGGFKGDGSVKDEGTDEDQSMTEA